MRHGVQRRTKPLTAMPLPFMKKSMRYNVHNEGRAPLLRASLSIVLLERNGSCKCHEINDGMGGD
jgi:hypothetical protein